MIPDKYKSKFIKLISAIIAVGLVLILTLAAFRRIPFGVFWVFVICSAIYAYWILPRLKKN